MAWRGRSFVRHNHDHLLTALMFSFATSLSYFVMLACLTVLSACLLACLFASLSDFLVVRLLACVLLCLLACLLSWLFACLLSCLLALLLPSCIMADADGTLF